MSEPGPDRGSFRVDQRAALLALYDRGVGDVYGYLRRRCPDDLTAQDLTSDTFLAAVDAVTHREVTAVSVPWLIGIARHKLLDHWRRVERQQRNLVAVGNELATAAPWDVTLDPSATQDALDRLNASYRAALTFRYLDDLPVRQVAALIGRPEQATEALLVRARTAFRLSYEDLTSEAGDD